MTPVLVQSPPEQADAASRLAAALGVAFEPVEIHTFPDGEFLPSVRPASTVIAYWSLYPANTSLVALLLAADAWRRAGVERIVLAAPYLCYMRQDAVFKPGQALSRDVIGGLLRPRFDRFVTVQAHLHRSPTLRTVFGPRRAEDISAAGPLASALGVSPSSLVVGPDVESAPWAARLAEGLGSNWITLAKTRRGDRDVFLDSVDLDRVSGRRVILTDDVVSSGETLIAAARLLGSAGAASIEAAVAHALFDAEVAERLKTAGVRRLVSTDSVPHPSNAAPLAGLLAAALTDELKS